MTQRWSVPRGYRQWGRAIILQQEAQEEAMSKKRAQGHKVDCETRVSRYFGYYDRSCPRCEEIYGAAKRAPMAEEPSLRDGSPQPDEAGQYSLAWPERKER